jgi:hypothetical protein
LLLLLCRDSLAGGQAGLARVAHMEQNTAINTVSAAAAKMWSCPAAAAAEMLMRAAALQGLSLWRASRPGARRPVEQRLPTFRRHGAAHKGAGTEAGPCVFKIVAAAGSSRAFVQPARRFVGMW